MDQFVGARSAARARVLRPPTTRASATITTSRRGRCSPIRGSSRSSVRARERHASRAAFVFEGQLVRPGRRDRLELRSTAAPRATTTRPSVICSPMRACRGRSTSKATAGWRTRSPRRLCGGRPAVPGGLPCSIPASTTRATSRVPVLPALPRPARNYMRLVGFASDVASRSLPSVSYVRNARVQDRAPRLWKHDQRRRRLRAQRDRHHRGVAVRDNNAASCS